MNFMKLKLLESTLQGEKFDVLIFGAVEGGVLRNKKVLVRLRIISHSFLGCSGAKENVAQNVSVLLKAPRTVQGKYACAVSLHSQCAVKSTE